ncbi:hypothetical protein FRC07_013867, partial [Ceratobasidium sp. 392]
RGYVRRKLLDAKVGRASSGGSAVRGITYSVHVFRDSVGHELNEETTQGAASMQPNRFIRIKAPTNGAINQNDNDFYLDESRHDK